MIRIAIHTDISQMAALSEKKRMEYEAYAPMFWRRAADSMEKQKPYFAAQLAGENAICCVSEVNGEIDGFIIAQVGEAPPVYDPGGLVCVVDDFVVAEPALWNTVGRDLLDEARRMARLRGAELAVVVCGQMDVPKREMLQAAGLYVASEWWVNP
jgi:GNAT superfamily N-acetyltransferase